MTFDVTTDLTEELMRANFNRWRGSVDVAPLTTSETEAIKTPVTHTFPDLNGRADLCQSILESDRGLLSDEKRRATALTKGGEETRHMIRARAVGLDRFVFAYLGVHDPYYSTLSTGPRPAFGIFVQGGIEAFPRCNASRRDLGSTESICEDDNPQSAQGEFLLPSDARELCAREVRTRHKNFWYYWGAIEFYLEEAYKREHWKWKFEFHFRDAVPVSEFDAILWPELQAADAAGSTRFGSLSDRSVQFARNHPGCRVLRYAYRNRTPGASLVQASTAVCRYILAHGEYPPTIQDAESRLHELTR
ncbi:MAG: hypothetical protein KF791_16060 [Verrucomicrobiae bacterium]|nr:hypothetical protein [Verrucomicrobiae bacterium]